jgi:hypothetical protein
MSSSLPLTTPAPWTEIPEPMVPLFDAPPRWWEVTVTAPHEGDADPLDLVPAGIPAAVTAVVTAAQVHVTVRVRADSLAEAALLGCLTAGEWGRLPGAEMSVRPVPGRAEAGGA